MRRSSTAWEGKHAAATWAVRSGLADDQVETFLLRLARASGIEGLRGMQPEVTLQAGTVLPCKPACSQGHEWQAGMGRAKRRGA